MELPIAQSLQANVRVMFVGQRIDTRAFEGMHKLGSAPLAVSAGSQGMAVIFRYGVIAFVALTPSEIIAFLADIQAHIVEPFAEPEVDEIVLKLEPQATEGFYLNTIQIQQFNLQRVQVIAAVLAKSVVLGHYEVDIARHFDRLEPLTAKLRAGHGSAPRGRQLLQHIGETLTIESKMIGRVEVSEKPELIWEQPEYERLYLRLEEEYEIKERQAAIERKLTLSSHTAQTMLDILQSQRTLRVEWYITLLIVVEIVITLVEKVLA